MSPTQRTLAALRSAGWICAVVERWNAHAGVRQDLFGFADILAIRPGVILAIQVTTGGNHAARRAKLDGEPRVRDWLAAGGAVELWSWSLRGERGKRKLWTSRVEAVRT